MLMISIRFTADFVALFEIRRVAELLSLGITTCFDGGFPASGFSTDRGVSSMWLYGVWVGYFHLLVHWQIEELSSDCEGFVKKCSRNSMSCDSNAAIWMTVFCEFFCGPSTRIYVGAGSEGRWIDDWYFFIESHSGLNLQTCFQAERLKRRRYVRRQGMTSDIDKEHKFRLRRASDEHRIPRLIPTYSIWHVLEPKVTSFA